MKSCIPNDSRTVTPIFKQLHSGDAVVTEIQGMLLKEEVEYIVKSAREKGLKPSTVVKDGNTYVDARRSSKTAFLNHREDPVLDCIGNRIATLSGQSATHLEPLQVTDYTHKQEYRAHHDYFDNPRQPERTTTLFAYLDEKNCSSQKCGGATTFHKLKQTDGSPLRVYPTVGNAVMWSNRTAKGDVNPETLHSGEKLSCPDAHKVGLNAWFRDEKWS